MRWLEKNWYCIGPPHLLLWPLSVLFGALAALRRALYRTGILRVTRVPVPVIVIGNISVGGTGKTPLVIWLAQLLREHGMAPGIVGRGYGGNARGPRQATADSDPAVVGDEAVLLARHSGCPVWIGAKRTATAQALLAAHPDCNVLISDDGMQHYALARDVEIAVIDGERGFGNGMLLPAGPLREPLARLAGLTALVINDGATVTGSALPHGVPTFDMQLGGRSFYDVLNPAQAADAERFARLRLHAVAAIGNPRRFFGHLQQLGLTFTAHPFPDHHAFSTADLAFADADAILMTEKDAVKCEQFANEKLWALRVDAEVDSALGELILHKIGK